MAYNWPVSFPIVEAMLVVDKLRGKPGIGRRDLIHAGWWVSGFAASMIPDSVAIPRLMAAGDGLAETVAQTLEKACSLQKGPGVIGPLDASLDWKTVWQFIRFMLDQWLAEA